MEPLSCLRCLYFSQRSGRSDLSQVAAAFGYASRVAGPGYSTADLQVSVQVQPAAAGAGAPAPRLGSLDGAPITQRPSGPWKRQGSFLSVPFCSFCCRFRRRFCCPAVSFPVPAPAPIPEAFFCRFRPPFLYRLHFQETLFRKR